MGAEQSKQPRRGPMVQAALDLGGVIVIEGKTAGQPAPKPRSISPQPLTDFTPRVRPPLSRRTPPPKTTRVQ